MAFWEPVGRWCALVAAFCAVSGSSLVDRGSEAAGSCGTQDGQLRAMTYNIRTGLGTDNPGANPLHQLFAPHDIGPVVAAIAAADPDVVALQEVLGYGQARDIAAALNMHSHFVFHPSPVPWWGNAVLSKCPMRQMRRVVTSRGLGNGKAMALGQVRVAGQDVTITSLHRDRDDNSGVQVDHILAALDDGHTPTLLMGDFNFVPSDARHARVAAQFADSATLAAAGSEKVRARGTFPSGVKETSGRRIDYVFVSAPDISVSSVQIMDEGLAAASDHLAYVADLRLQSKEK